MTITIYTRNQPVASDDLDVSQPFLVSNTNGADTIFGKEHYAFSNQTVNQGLHNTVTTPSYIASPPTSLAPVTAANPIFYGFQQTTPLGVLQYSRGPNNAAPTPVTSLQSPLTPITLATATRTQILDFTGIPQAYGTFYVVSLDAFTGVYLFQNFPVYWNGTTLIITNSPSQFGLTSVGNILYLSNNGGTNKSNIFWTLVFYRLQ